MRALARQHGDRKLPGRDGLGLSYPCDTSMRAVVIVFPGSNCDRDLVVALRMAGAEVTTVWHKDSDLPQGVDVVGLPGGFSFGDYLRCGAIAANAPICRAVAAHAQRGGFVLGICNGFQILTEIGLLPGALRRNARQKFICRAEALDVATTGSVFTQHYVRSNEITLPIAHGDGNFFADSETLNALVAGDRVAFRYKTNPNGSQRGIAAILSENRRVLGMMPHPERAVDPGHGGIDGLPLFSGVVASLSAGPA